MHGQQYATPTFEPWMRNLLVALVGIFVIELLLPYAGVDPYVLLAWQPIGAGFQPWQPVTRYLVQGSVMSVLFGALLLYFLLPALWFVIDPERIRNAAIAGLLGGTLLPLLLDLVIADGGVMLGWGTFAGVLCATLFGLAMPEDTIYLMFVIPVNGRFVLWGTAVISGLVLLLGAAGSHSAGEAFGTWAGIYGWWQLRGPGARRRELEKKAANIEKELMRFRVIEGGKRDDDNREPDEWVN